MRKKTVARMMSAVITGSMIISLAACGSSSAPAAESAPVESAAASTEAETTEETTNAEPLEFSYYGPIWKPYQESTPIFDELMKRTNTMIDFEWVSNDALETQLASKVASGDLPDVISGGTSAAPGIQDLIKQGVIVPITDYLEKDMPNYVRFLEGNDYLTLTNYEDGEIYGFGLVMDVPPAFSTAIRTDWLEKLNLEMPKTWEDWVTVWKAFAKEDANGNGDPNDEVPFAVSHQFFKFVLNMFGMQSNGEFSVVDGEYLYDPENPNYEKFLDSMRELYAEGILPKEFVTLEGADFNTLGASNTLGSYVGYAEYSKNYTISCRELDEDAFYQCVIPIPGPDGAQNIPARAKVSSTTYITVKALQEGKLERILQFFDYVYSDEGIELTNYGIEGTNFEMVDNKPTLVPPYNESFAVARENGLIPSTIPFCFTEDVYMQILMGGVTYDELEDSGQTFIDGMTINEPYYYDEPPVIQTEAYADHFDLLEQQVALRDKYIMGQISKDDYNSGYEKLKQGGLNNVIEQGKEAYQKISAQ